MARLDPVLRERLIRAGRLDELRALESDARRSSVLRQFGPALKETWTDVAEGSRAFGTELGGDIGRLAFQYTKEGRDLQARAAGGIDVTLERQLLKRIREAKSKEDRQKWFDILQRTRNSVRPEDYLKTATEGRTERQILTDTGKLALNVLPFAPARGIPRAAGVAQKLTRAQKLAKLGIAAAKDFIPGAAYGALEAQSREGVGAPETIRQAGTMGAFTALFPPVVGNVLRGTLKGVGFVGKKTAVPVVRAGIRKLEQIALRTEPKLPKGIPVEEAALRSFYRAPTTTGQKLARKTLGIVRGVQGLEQKFTNRFSPVLKFERDYQSAVGRPLTDKERVEMNFSLAPWRALDSSSRFAHKAGDIMNRYDDVGPELRQYIGMKDFQNRLKLGQPVVQGHTPGSLSQLEGYLSTKLGPEKFAKVQQGQQEYVNLSRSLLRELVDSGAMSEQRYQALLKKYPDYFPHDVVVKELNDVIQSVGNPHTLNVSELPIKKAVGSERQVEDPFEALVGRAPKIYHVSEATRALHDFFEVAATPEGRRILPDVFPVVTEKLSALAARERNLEKITFYSRDAKQEWFVPKDIGVAIRNIGAQELPWILKAAAKPADLLRAGATRYNISFPPANWPRDIQTAMITGNLGFRGFLDWFSMSGKDGKALVAQYMKEGGLGSSIMREYKKPEDVVKILQRTGAWQKVKHYSNPLKLVEEINTGIEMSTRLAVFRKQLIGGMSPKQAAYAARNATIDFDKMGTWMRPLNRVIPFLNARVQGTLNIGKAFLKSPEQFARVQMYTAAIPTAILHDWNRQFQSYQNIPDYVKNRYWVIMRGETDGVDNQGNPIRVPQFFTIVKGEPQQLISNPIQYFLEHAEGIDNRSVQKMFLDTGLSLSPIGFQTYDSGNLIRSMISSLGPTVSVPAGLYSNIEPFTGQKIIPENRLKASPEVQFQKTTPESVKQIAGILGVSPAQADFVISSFGGAPSDLTKFADIIANKQLPKSYSQTRFGGLSRTPVIRRFLREAGEAGSPRIQEEYRQKEEIEKKVNTERLKLFDRSEKHFKKIQSLGTPEERKRYVLEEVKKGTFAQEDIKNIGNILTGGNRIGPLTETDPVKVRAQFIFNKLERLSPEEKKKYVVQLLRKGLLTTAVIKEISSIIQQ